MAGLGGVGGSSDSSRRAEDSAAREAAARAAVAPARETAPAAVSRPADVFEPAVGGVAQAQRAYAQTQAARSIYEATRAVDAGVQRLDAANVEVAKVEEQLAKELAQLVGALEPEQLTGYAESYRAEHRAAYDEARAAAADVALTLVDQVPGAVAASAAPGFEVASATTWFSDSIERAADALGTYVRQSPVADVELSRTLGEAQAQLSEQLDAAVSTGQVGLEAYGKTVGRFADVARLAGHAFGVVAGAFDAVENVSRIASGDARAEHVVGATAAITEIGASVLAIGGVTVAAPIAAVAGVVSLGASATSGIRDRAALEQSVARRLEQLGYAPDTARGLAGAHPGGVAALREAGYSAEQVQTLAAVSPRTLQQDASVVNALASAAAALGLTSADVTRMAVELGPAAADVLIEMATTQARFGDVTGPEYLELLRSENPAFASEAMHRAAKWLAANRAVRSSAGAE